MTAFDDLHQAINRATGGNSGTPKNIPIFKDSRVGASAAANTVAGRWTSLWLYNGNPSGGDVPTTVVAPTEATSGTFRQADPGGGRQQWLYGCSAFSPSQGVLKIYDRLLQIGGLDGTVTSAQTVGGTLTRNTGGIGNEIFVEINTAIGATGTTAVVNYTDQGGSASVSPAFTIGGTGFNEAQRLLPVPLAVGDYGVQGVTDIDLVASTTTAGNFGVIVAHHIATIHVGNTNSGGVRPLILEGAPVEIESSAALAFAWFANSTTPPQIYGHLFMAER